MALAERVTEILYLDPRSLLPRLDQPRQLFEDDKMRVLVDSIRAQGFNSQITVREVPEGYEILAGHRRTRAAIEVGLDEVPCVVHNLDDNAAREFVLFDNFGRDDLKVWEEGAGFRELSNLGLSLAAIGQKIGKSEGYVRGRILLAENLGERAREAHIAGDLGIGTLQALAELPNRPLQTRDCPRCKRLSNNEDGPACPGCLADLSEVHLTSGGNPQGAAVGLILRTHASPEAARGIVERVKESYGLDNRAGQLAMDLQTMMAAPEVVAAKHKLDSWLGEIGKMGGWILNHRAEVERLPQTQREAIGQQAEAALAVIREVQRAVGPQGELF